MISVIIPVYNVESYLKRCLDSVINQSYQDLEIILIDDGSTDNSSKICDEYASNDPRVIVIHKQNAGQAAARNDGINIAKGEYIAFVDSDDWIELDMYELLMQAIIDTKADIVASGLNMVYQNRVLNLNPNSVSRISYTKEEALDSLFNNINNVRFELWNKLFKKEVIGDARLKIGQLHEEVYFIRTVFSNATRIVYVNQGLYNYVVQRDGNTNSNFKENRLVIFQELDDFASMLREWGREDIARKCENFAITMAINFYIIANKAGVSDNILNFILKTFNRYYKKEYLHSLNRLVFSISPKLYLILRHIPHVFR